MCIRDRKYVNKENDLKASIGGRMFADVAYYHTEWTPMKSGAAITDARIHASLTYGKLFIYADFGFGNGEFSQKNLFAQYTFKESLKGIHLVKAGYYNEPSSMSMMTSSYNYHFISRPSVSQALDPGRSLGATYKFFNRHFFADQGIFSQLKYNEQEEGYQGFSLSGRWLWKPINDNNITLQFGTGLRYQRINGGEAVSYTHLALISNGLIKQAQKQARTNINSIRKSVLEKKIPVIATSSTCTFTIRDEYPHLLDIDNADVREDVELATRYIYRLLSQKKTKLNFKTGQKIKVAYHTPCHMEKLGWAYYSIELLKLIPNIELTILDSQCCGIAGTYGFKKENYKTSQDIGEPLFKQIEALDIDCVVTDCETCKWQIEMSTSKRCEHPISILSNALE